MFKKRVGLLSIFLALLLFTVTTLGCVSQTTKDNQTTQSTEDAQATEEVNDVQVQDPNLEHEGVILLSTFYEHLKNRDFQKAGEMFSPYMLWEITLYGGSHDPPQYLKEMFDYPNLTFEVSEVHEDLVYADVFRKDGVTGFLAHYAEGKWVLHFDSSHAEAQLKEREAFVRGMSKRSEPEKTQEGSRLSGESIDELINKLNIPLVEIEAFERRVERLHTAAGLIRSQLFSGSLFQSVYLTSDRKTGQLTRISLKIDVHEDTSLFVVVSSSFIFEVMQAIYPNWHGIELFFFNELPPVEEDYNAGRNTEREFELEDSSIKVMIEDGTLNISVERR